MSSGLQTVGEFPVILPSVKKAPERKSHLPAWLLASTAAVEASQKERGMLEDRLSGLKKDVLVLETLMDKEKSSYASILAARANAALLRNSKLSDERNNCTCNIEAEEEEDYIPRRAFGLHRLPTDITNEISQFGGAKELANFSLTSMKAYTYMSQDEAGWTGLYRQHALMIWNTCPYTDLRLIANVSKMKTPKPTRKFKQKDSGEPLGAEEEEVERISRLSSSTRNQVLHHASAMSRVVGFLMHLQETRSSKRTKDIKPKVYSRRDRDVSHPLPFLGVGGALDDKIMSQANTMNKDTRQEALYVLEIMVLLTANKLDQKSLSLLRRKGAMTVMVALLTNESASIQELAAATIANLLITGLDVSFDVDPRVSLNRCNGRNPLVSLLTSPTASLNTMTSMPSNLDVSKWRNQSSFCTTTFSMGMASKHASRALINAWCPDYTIAQSMLEDSITVPWHGTQLKGAEEERIVSDLGNDELDKDSYWMAYYFYSKGTEKDSRPIKIDLLSNGVIQGYGSDNLGKFVLKGKAQDVRMGSLTYNFTLTYTDRGNIPPDGHISLVGFWAGGSESDISFISDGGLWGIWEHVTGVPHFELERGGVFRFVQIKT